MARPPRWKPEQMAAALDAYAQGASIKEIQALGVPWSTMLAHAKKNGLPRRQIGRPPHGERKPFPRRGGYLYVYVPHHPYRNGRGPVMLHHRWVMELHLGRALERHEVVHHKDHNKHNNALSNLEVQDRAAHTREHRVEDVAAGMGPEFLARLHAGMQRKGLRHVQDPSTGRFYVTSLNA